MSFTALAGNSKLPVKSLFAQAAAPESPLKSAGPVDESNSVDSKYESK